MNDKVRIAKSPTLEVNRWLRPLLHTARRSRMTLPQDQAVRLAALVTLVGTVESPDAQRVFWAFTVLFFNQKRVGRWDSAIRALPTTREGLLRVADCCQAYSQAPGHENLPTAALRLDEVILVMVQIPEPAAYVKHVMSSGDLVRAGAVFHPNTLENARKRLRGMLGELSEMGQRHAVQSDSKLRITYA